MFYIYIYIFEYFINVILINVRNFERIDDYNYKNGNGIVCDEFIKTFRI